MGEILTMGTINELQLVSINQAAKLLHINRGEIIRAMDVFRQSGGRAGLAYIARGARRVVRAGAIKAWLIGIEREGAAA